MGKWFVKLKPNQKALFVMGAIAVIVFIGLTPLFFFHDYDGKPMGRFPLGWLLGSVAEILSFYSLMAMSDGLFSKKNSAQAATMAASVGSAALRMGLYAVVLVVSAICTFKSEWFGGFDAFNFFTTAAGLLPMLFVVLFVQLYQVKHDASAPQGSAPQGNESKPSEGDKK